MEFIQKTDISANSGNSVVKGICNINGKNIECVEKTFPSEESFKKIDNIISNHEGILEEIGPHVYFIDKENQKIYMEFIACETVEDYIRRILEKTFDHEQKTFEIDLKNTGENYELYPEDVKILIINLIESAHTLFDIIDKHRVVHTDLHLGNVLRCEDGTLKIIDFDDLKDQDDLVPDEHDKELFFEVLLKELYKNNKEIKSQKITKIVENISTISDIRDRNISKFIQENIRDDLKKYVHYRQDYFSKGRKI